VFRFFKIYEQQPICQEMQKKCLLFSCRLGFLHMYMLVQLFLVSGVLMLVRAMLARMLMGVDFSFPFVIMFMAVLMRVFMIVRVRMLMTVFFVLVRMLVVVRVRVLMRMLVRVFMFSFHDKSSFFPYRG
jgi:hypothetical protein